MRVGILTGGGDCPGLNAAIRAVTWKVIDDYGWKVLGINDGWAGLIDGNFQPLTLKDVYKILLWGGTILGTSRTNPFKGYEKVEDPEEWKKIPAVRKILANIEKEKIDAIAVLGGEDTLGVADKLLKLGVPSVGIPKTIDNDLSSTDICIGFDSVICTVTEAIDKLHTTADSHHRVMVVEVMGRNTGWIAVTAGLAGGVDCILIPEVPFKMADVYKLVKETIARGIKSYCVIVVAEGAEPDGMKITKTEELDEFGHVTLGGIGIYISAQIEKHTKIETRATTLGHIQRGGPPTPYDRAIATHFGIRAVDLIYEGKFGYMTALQGNRITTIPYEEALKTTKKVDLELYEIAQSFWPVKLLR